MKYMSLKKYLFIATISTATPLAAMRAMNAVLSGASEKKREQPQLEESPAAVTASSSPLVRSASMTRLSDLPTAARNNLIREVCALLQDERTNIDAATTDGFTALHWAARNGHQEVVSILLAHKANPIITTPEGETAMQLAQEKNRNAVVSLLLKHQGEYQNGPGASVELLPAQPSALSKLPAVQGGNFDYKEVLSPEELARARKDKNRINQPDAHGLTQLHNAVKANDTFRTRQLVQRGAHIDARRLGHIGNGAVWLHTTPLLDALDEDNIEMTELLVALGANLELAAPYTPLFWAAIHDRVAVAKILIKGGADLQTEGRIGFQDVQPRTLCALAAAEAGKKYAMVQFLTDQGATFGKSKSRRFFMHFKEAKGIVLKAVTEHNKDTLEKVLRLDGIGKDEMERRDKYGQTPLLLAVECCLTEIALMLIAFKADVTAQDDEGGTALHYAASEGNQIKLVKALIKAQVDVNTRNKHGETALHVAAQRKVKDDKKVATALLKVVTLLLTKADVKLVDSQGKTALHHAD